MTQGNTRRNVVHIGRNMDARGQGPIQIESIYSFNAKDSSLRDTSSIDTKLGPLLRGLIEGAQLGKSFMSSGLYRLTFSPSATKALSDGTLSIVATDGGLRAWAVESGSRRIVEQGVLNLEKAIAVAQQYKDIADKEVSIFAASAFEIRRTLNTAISLSKGDRTSKGPSFVVQITNGNVHLLEATEQ